MCGYAIQVLASTFMISKPKVWHEMIHQGFQVYERA